MYRVPQIDFELSSSPFFVGSEMQFSGRLTIFGQDLPQFREWASKNGVGEMNHIVDSATYLAADHETVAHKYTPPIRLNQGREISTCIQMLISKAERLVLFLEIVDHCTVETVRHMLRTVLPNMTFRIVYPRGMYKASGLKVVLVERRRPRIFLFLSGQPMAGKTETALSLGDSSKVTIVHGDDYLHKYLEDGNETSRSVAERIQHIHYHPDRETPFDRALFADFIALIPAFRQSEDVAFDFFMPNHMHLDVSKFFEELEFFPVLCLMPADQTVLRASRQEAYSQIEAELARKEAAFYRQQAENYRGSISWRLTSPLRVLGRQCPALVRAMRRLIGTASAPAS